MLSSADLLKSYNQALVRRYSTVLGKYINIPLCLPMDRQHAFSLKDLVDRYEGGKPILILGDSGVGKTTLLVNLVREIDSSRILFLKMKFLNDKRSIREVVELSIAEELRDISEIFNRRISPMEISRLVDSLLEEDLIMLFDGMNEISGNRVRIVQECLQEFLLRHYWDKFVFTCRLEDTDMIRMVSTLDVSTYVLRPFEIEEVYRYILNFPDLTDSERNLLLNEIWKNKKVLEIARNPHHLSYLVQFFIDQKKLPSNLSYLYAKVIESILKKEEMRPGYDVEFEVPLPAKIDITANIAAEMTSRGTLHILSRTYDETQLDLVYFLSTLLDVDRKTRSKVPKNLLENPLRLVQSLIMKTLFTGFPESGYSFIHQSFQEFLTALWLKRYLQYLTQDELKAQIRKRDWEEAFVFLMTMFEPAKCVKLLEQACSAGDEGIFLAAKCIRQLEDTQYRELVKPYLFHILLQSRSNEDRARVMELIYDFGFGHDAEDTLINALNDRNWMVREGAVRIIGDLKLKKSENEVKKLLLDEVMWVRASAVWALGEIGLRSSEQAISSAFNDSCDLVVRWAQSAMKSLDWPISQDREWFRNLWEAKVLGEYEASDVEDYYMKGLQSADWWIRVVAIEALAQLESQRAKPYLFKLSTNGNEWIRAWVMRALGELRYAESEDILMRALRDGNNWVRVWAAESLRKLRSTEAENALLMALLESEDKYVKLAVVSALAECGTNKSMQKLKEIQDGQDPDLAAEATNALSSIMSAEKEAIHLSVFSIVKRASVPEEKISSRQLEASLQGLDQSLISALKPEIEKLAQQVSVNTATINEFKATLPTKSEFYEFVNQNRADLQELLVRHLENLRKLTREEKEKLSNIIDEFVRVEDSTKFVLRLPLLIGYLEKSYEIKLDIGKSVVTIIGFLTARMKTKKDPTIEVKKGEE